MRFFVFLLISHFVLITSKTEDIYTYMFLRKLSLSEAILPLANIGFWIGNIQHIYVHLSVTIS